MKKIFYTPIVTIILYAIFYGVFMPFLILEFSEINFLTSIPLIIFLIALVARLTYRLKVENGLITEHSLFFKFRSLPISSLSKIQKHKMLWYEGYILNPEGRRMFYFISHKFTNFPMFAIDRKIINFLKELNPNIEID